MKLHCTKASLFHSQKRNNNQEVFKYNIMNHTLTGVLQCWLTAFYNSDYIWTNTLEHLYPPLFLAYGIVITCHKISFRIGLWNSGIWFCWLHWVKPFPNWILTLSWMLVNDITIYEYHTHTALLTCCHWSRMSGRYRRKYFRGKLSMSGQVAGLCQDTSSLRGLKRIGVAVTRSGGSGLTVVWIRTII